MDQMCPNWPKNEVFVSFLKFKPSDSAEFAYSSSFLLSLTTIATKLAEKIFRLKIRPSPNYFNGFWLFSQVFFIRNRRFCTFQLLSIVWSAPIVPTILSVRLGLALLSQRIEKFSGKATYCAIHDLSVWEIRHTRRFPFNKWFFSFWKIFSRFRSRFHNIVFLKEPSLYLGSIQGIF